MPLFLLVAFGFSWAVAAVIWFLQPGQLPRVGLTVIYMMGPALGAIISQRRAGEPWRGLGFRFQPDRWWLVAWCAPIVVSLSAAGVGLLMPGVTPAFDMSGILDRVPLSDAELVEARAQLAQFPPLMLFLLQLVQALVAAVSINMVATLGEELGWRGWLHTHLPALAGQLWRRSLLIGVLWGVWHAPIVLQGHNYPEHPVIGVGMMVVFCVLLAPWFEFIRERTGSVLAASILHGSVNASAGFAILFLRGGSDLVVGMTGLAGFMVLGVANLILWRITTKE